MAGEVDAPCRQTLDDCCGVVTSGRPDAAVNFRHRDSLYLRLQPSRQLNERAWTS